MSPFHIFYDSNGYITTEARRLVLLMQKQEGMVQWLGFADNGVWKGKAQRETRYLGMCW